MSPTDVFIYYVIKHCDDMKLCEQYGFATRDEHSANFEYFRLSVM